MKLKLKQSNSISKHLAFPIINHPYQYPHRYTPRSKLINQSLPKIPESYISSPPNIPNQRSRLKFDDRSAFRQKIKSGYQKKKHMATPSPSLNESYPNRDLEEGNITQNFKKQIEKNLVFIKKEKENRKKSTVVGKTRYNTPRHGTLQSQHLKRLVSRPIKCVTEEDDVFSKINEIIIKSQSNPTHLIEDARHISFSSYIAKDKYREKSDSLEDKQKGSKKHLRTEGNSDLHIVQDEERQEGSNIKHVGNYHQWRKLSINSEDQRKISYNISSYEYESDRIEKIRNKNELSLKKYIEGKSYLSKLIKYRDSSILLSHDK